MTQPQAQPEIPTTAPSAEAVVGADASGEQTEVRSFQAETARILELMIHSVYSHREVFLRELISNASDAIDKVRFLALTDEGLRAAGGHDYAIRLRPDAVTRTLQIEDNGVGMSYDEVVQNIGTIARSGTAEFVRRLEEAQKAGDTALIGRFGIGFYSSFIAAERVVLETWKYGERHGVRWESKGDGSYTIAKTAPRARGTCITLHLRPVQGEDETLRDFTEAWVLRDIVRKHSDFVAFPVVLETWRVETKPKSGADDEDNDGDDASALDETAAGPRLVGADGQTRQLHRETLNRQKPLWSRDPKEITTEEYAEFYRHISHDWSDPADRLHVRAEGTHEFIGLLFTPARAPFDLYAREGKRGLSLYVRNVFVMDDCRDLLPEYMRFVRGLIDSPDLPLNVSREVAQQDRLLAHIRKVLVKRLWDRYKAWLAEDRSKYETFWSQFGAVLKESLHYDPTQQDKLEGCLLVRSSHGEGWSTLEEVKGRRVEGQEKLYYLAGDELATIRKAPHLEEFRARGVEVLLFSDPIDQVAMTQIAKLGGVDLVDAADPALDLGGLGKTDADDTKSDHKPAEAGALGGLLAALTTALGASVQDVRQSRRLRDSAAVLVSADDAPHASVERMMRAMGEKVPERKRVLELNPTHPLVQRLVAMHEADGADPRVAQAGELLVDQALVAAGEKPRDPAAFASRIDAMLRMAFGA